MALASNPKTHIAIVRAIVLCRALTAGLGNPHWQTARHYGLEGYGSHVQSRQKCLNRSGAKAV
jgi:hypothetical protein